MVKAAIIADADLFGRIERTTFEALRTDTDLLSDAVSAAIRVKADIVERDERESGDRRKLNLGHTLAHAIEKASNRMNHGEAVAVGTALIAFTGGLGAGKTAFTEGLAEGLGCTDPVSSPTFAIVNYYRGPRPLAHFDLYRISTENDLCAAGFYDYLDQGAVVAAEWSENFADLLALENPIRVNIERLDDTTRKITIEGVTV